MGNKGRADYVPPTSIEIDREYYKKLLDAEFALFMIKRLTDAPEKDLKKQLKEVHTIAKGVLGK